MNISIKFIRLLWITASILVFSLFFNCLNAQQPSERERLLIKIDAVRQVQNNVNSDSLLTSLREEAWSLKEDSLYVELTLWQIERSREDIDIFEITDMLEDLMQKKYESLKKYPRLLLHCYLNLGKFHLSQNDTSLAFMDLGIYYYERYFEILKTITLNSSDLVVHQNHRLSYLEKTKNDSLFYYLEAYNTPKQEENLILARWYRSQNNHKKELYHAKNSEDSNALFIAYKNNLKFSKVDSLFPVLLKEYIKGEELFDEHLLYLNMGHRYGLERRFYKATQMYLKALHYFEDNKKYNQLSECLKAISDIKSKSGDIDAFKFYNTKLNTLKQQELEERLVIIKNYLNFINDLSDLELKTKNKADNLEKIQALNDLKYQKTITSIGLAFFLVFSVFTFFYFQSTKEKEFLEYKNEKMKIDVLRSKFKPHFTFNALSVINYFIAKKDVENASLALTKMASLLRSTLDNLSKDLVSYESEYSICEHYMYLELLRFSDKFECNFKVLNDDVIKEWKIPPGIIEPFLENAVNHAFKGVKKKGLIYLNHQIKDECLVITIGDNGTGIDTEKLYSENIHGLKITNDVVNATSKLYKNPIGLEIKTDAGTIITLTIPRLKS